MGVGGGGKTEMLLYVAAVIVIALDLEVYNEHNAARHCCRVAYFPRLLPFLFPP